MYAGFYFSNFVQKLIFCVHINKYKVCINKCIYILIKLVIFSPKIISLVLYFAYTLL